MQNIQCDKQHILILAILERIRCIEMVGWLIKVKNYRSWRKEKEKSKNKKENEKVKKPTHVI